MRLHQHVGHRYTAAQSRLFTRMAGILVAADIEPRPAIEGAFAYPSQEIWRKLVAEAVALVDRAPEVAVPGLHRHSDTVPQAGREEPFVFALRREGEHDGAALVGLPRRIDPTIGGVAARADRYEHAGAIVRKDEIARPVPASRQTRDDRLGRAGRLQLSRTIGVADHVVGVRDIDVSRIWPRRPESDTK